MKQTITIILLFIFLNSFSQEYNYPLGNYFDRKITKEIYNSDAVVHTSVKPLRVSYIEKSINQQDILIDTNRQNLFARVPYGVIWKSIFYDDFIRIEKTNLSIYANPLYEYSKTRLETDDYQYGQNTRGFEVHGNLGNKLSFYTDFYENQAFFLPYIQSNVDERLIAPGQGVWKPFGDDKYGRDYNYATGYISFFPIEVLNVQIGRSKHFIGSGYRSMLLSDNSAPYPFLKLTYTKNKFQYSAMFTEFQDFRTKFYFYHYKKNGSFLFANYFPVKNLEIGLFEGIIWKTTNNSTFERKIPALYYLPIPGVREAVYGFNNENNILVGLNASYRLFNFAEIYSQFALDDVKTKRYSYQTGFKVFDLFNEKINRQNLYIQGELNYAKPHTYMHEYAYSAFTNFNEPLINTLGSGFNEKIGIINWQLYGFELEIKYNSILTSTDTLGTNFGTNLMLSNTTASYSSSDAIVGQGNETSITNLNFSFGYIVNPKSNLKIFVSANKRRYKSEIIENNLFFITFGIKSSLNNIYTDY